MIFGNLPGFRGVLREGREMNFVKLEPVEASMVVATRADRFR